MINAIVLVSGGLDSLLVVKLMQQTNISFKVVHFDIGLTHDQPIVAGQRISKYFGLEDLIRNGIEIDKIDVAKEFYSHILNIKDFTNYNSCLEYKVFILQKAKEYMKSVNAQFIVTGDVLDQRVLIQGKDALHYMDQRANVEKNIFRPLSAKLLDDSPLCDVFPILEDISYKLKGFSVERKELAKKLGIVYNESIQDKFKTQEIDMGRKAFEIFEKHKQINLAHLNRVGIHFKLPDSKRCVVGRTPFESNYLKQFYNHMSDKQLAFECVDSTLLFGFVYGDSFSESIDEELALSIFKSSNTGINNIRIYDKSGELLGSKIVKPLTDVEYNSYVLHSNELFCPMIFQ